MAAAKITLIGMYQYLNSQTPSVDLFGDIALPTGMNKDTLIDAIMMKGAEFEPIYSDADLMKYVIGAWSKKWQRTLEKWYNASVAQYNPLDSFERFEEWSDDKAGTRKDKGTSSDVSASKSSGTSEGNKAAYDSATYSPVDQNVDKNETDISSASQTNNEGNSTESAIHVGREHGSEGAATPQSQIEAEWKVATLNLYDSAADLFLQELCIYVY